MNETPPSIFKYYPDQFWRDALIVALATHPDPTLRNLTGVLTVERTECLLPALPEGLFALVRRCVDLVAGNAPSQVDANRPVLQAIINEKLTGQLPAFDDYLMNTANRELVADPE